MKAFKLSIPWLESLLDGVEALSAAEIAGQEPEGEVEEGEIKLGTVPAGLRKLHAYRGILIDRYMALKKEHAREHAKPGHTKKMCEEFGVKISPLDEAIDVLGKIFWRELRIQLQVKPSDIGIRKGWQVVETPEEEEQSPRIQVIGGGGLDQLAALLGGAIGERRAGPPGYRKQG